MLPCIPALPPPVVSPGIPTLINHLHSNPGSGSLPGRTQPKEAEYFGPMTGESKIGNTALSHYDCISKYLGMGFRIWV